jgi:predicted GIY-YIG superfamily endonuclease
MDKTIIDELLEEKHLDKSFSEIINGMENLLLSSKYIQKSVLLKNYFGNKCGQKTARKKLINDNIIQQNWIKNEIDFKGLYIFLYNNVPFYVGISQRVLSRIIDHVKGKSHFSASLAYNIGLLKYKKDNGCEYSGERENLDFKKYIIPAQEFLMDQKIALIHIDNNEELYLFEIYCAMKFKTKLNTFETH